MGTTFASVYNRFLEKITDDMYMELTLEDTRRDLQALLLGALTGFEFPKVNLSKYVFQQETVEFANPDDFVIELQLDGTVIVDRSHFVETLSNEEINIIAILMVADWLQRQIASIEMIRMKYSGTDFKMTSQANHLAKLLSLQEEVRRQAHHYQRLYGRRVVDEEGKISSRWSIFGKKA